MKKLQPHERSEQAILPLSPLRKARVTLTRLSENRVQFSLQGEIWCDALDGENSNSGDDSEQKCTYKELLERLMSDIDAIDKDTPWLLARMRGHIDADDIGETWRNLPPKWWLEMMELREVAQKQISEHNKENSDEHE